MDAPENWERKLKDDLMLSSHSASLNPTPTENVALIADMEEWYMFYTLKDVQLLIMFVYFQGR